MENFASNKNNELYRRRPLFFLHLFLYIAITSLLVTVNLIVTPENIWTEWIIIGWGLAVLLHELLVFVFAKVR